MHVCVHAGARAYAFVRLYMCGVVVGGVDNIIIIVFKNLHLKQKIHFSYFILLPVISTQICFTDRNKIRIQKKFRPVACTSCVLAHMT